MSDIPKPEVKSLFKNKRVMYIALALAVVIFIYAMRMKKTKAAASTDTTATDLAGSGDSAADTSQPVFGATPTVVTQPSGVGTTGGVDLAGTGGTSVTAVPMPDSDNLWARRAIPWLQSKGWSLQNATDAIENYLNGNPLTNSQAQARDEAVAQFGLPPDTIPTNTIITTPTPPIFHPPAPVPKPPASHPIYYTATSATRTLNAIAAKNGVSVHQIETLNPHLHFPVAVGTRVRTH